MSARITCLMLVLLFATPAYLAAQQDRIVAPGSRIRVFAPSIKTEPFVATVVSPNSDGLTLEAETWLDGVWKPRLHVSFSAMNSLELSQERHSNTGKGALIGGLLGAGLGFGLGVAAQADDCFCPGPPDGAELVLISTASVGLLGTGIGAIIGALTRSESWQPVPADKLRLGVSPVARQGATVSISIRR